MLHAAGNAGYLMQREGRAPLSPKGVRKIGQLALRDIYQGLAARPPRRAPDRSSRAGRRLEPDETRRLPVRRPAGPRPRRHAPGSARARPGDAARASHPDDFEVYDADDATSTSTVLLLDMSWSMSWEGRFAAGEEGRDRDGEPDPLALSARLLRDRRLLHARRRAEAPRPARGELEHGRPVHQPAGRAAPRRRAPGAPPEHQPALHRHHRRPADRVLRQRAPLLRVAAVASAASACGRRRRR